MLKKLLFFFIFISLWLPSAHARNTLLVFSADAAKPLVWKEEGQIAGPIGDIIMSVFNNLGVKVKSPNLPWPRALRMMEAGKIDMILTMFYTPERAKFMVYSVPYTQAHSSVFVKKGRKFSYSKWKDLIGRMGLVTLYDSYGAEFDKFAKDHLEFYYVGSWQQITKMLIAERGDFTIRQKRPALIEIAKMGFQGKIVPLPVPLTKQDVYITFSKKSPFLKYLPKVNQQIQEMRDNGTIEKMLNKATLDSINQ